MTLGTPTDLKPELGQPTAEIETPAVIVDLAVMDRNIGRFVDFADEHGVQLRSHIKTHKTPDFAHRQNEVTDGGGIVCQTLGEAEVMAQSGLQDIYLSYMVVDESKLDRLVWLSDKLDRFVTTVDGPGNVVPLQRVAKARDTTIEVVIELDLGLNRVGVRTPAAAVDLADFVDARPNLALVGVMAFEGHIPYDSTEDTELEFEDRCLTAMDEVETTVRSLEQAGHPVQEVKVGSTPTSLYSGKHPVVTEINPGMYPFNDIHTIRATPALTQADCALTVLTTVISKPADDRAIVDAGSKTISLELEDQPVEKHHPELRYFNASEEHGWIDTAEWDEAPIDVGDRLQFIIPHVCPTINLHDSMVGVRDDQVEEVWEIQARGKVK